MGIGRQSALFDCVSVALLDFEPSLPAIAPETQIEYPLAEAQIGEKDIDLLALENVHGARDIRGDIHIVIVLKQTSQPVARMLLVIHNKDGAL